MEKAISSLAALNELIDGQKIHTEIDISVRKSIKTFNVTAILGQRQYIEESQMDSSIALYKEIFSKEISQLEEFVLGLIKEHQQQAALDDILDRYQYNELVDYGQRLPVFRYVHLFPLKTPQVVEYIAQRITEAGAGASPTVLSEILDVSTAYSATTAHDPQADVTCSAFSDHLYGNGSIPCCNCQFLEE